MQPGQGHQMRKHVEPGDVQTQDGQPIIGDLIKARMLSVGQERICAFVAHPLLVSRLQALDDGIPSRVGLRQPPLERNK